MSSERKGLLVRAVATAILAICCIGIKLAGGAQDASWPYVAGGFCVFLTIAYIKRFFDN